MQNANGRSKYPTFAPMFTGIIEGLGQVLEISASGTNKSYWIGSPLSHELKTDQSVSHNGVCLTVEEVSNDRHRVTAIAETLLKSNLGLWKTGDLVNLERCMVMNGRLDGHIVQGHVDATGACLQKTNKNGSWEYRFEFPDGFAPLLIEKGSISVNGISLTAFQVTPTAFSVAIIPYTFEHTNIKTIEPGHTVNFEFDIVGKYIAAYLKNSQAH